MSIRTRTSGITFEVLPPTPATLEAETLAWVAGVTGQGGTVSEARKIVVNSMILSLKNGGVWTKLDFLFIFAAENEPSAYVDMISQIIATFVNPPVSFAVDAGYTPDGATNYIKTNFSPDAAGGNWTQNSACLFGWTNTALLGQYLATCQTLDNNSYTHVWTDAAGNPSWAVNQKAVLETAVGGGTSTGLYLCNRTAANAETFDINGVEIDSAATASTAFTGLADVRVGFWAGFYGGGQSCCVGGGGALTPTERTTLYSTIRAYMTAVGVP